MFDWYFYVGLVAALCIAIYTIPQLVKTIKTKNTESLSKEMMILSSVGAVLFVVNGFGVLFEDPDILEGIASGLPIIIANVVSGTISIILSTIKLVHRRKARKLGITEGELAKLMLAKKAKKSTKKSKGK